MTLLPPSLGVVTPSEDFESAARSVLSFLRRELELDMALVSRRVDAHYIVLAADDDRWNMHDGKVLVWDETLCATVVAGDADFITPRVDDSPALAAARALQGADIASYVSVPMRDREGGLTGTLCGASATPRTDEFVAKLAIVQLLADLLGTLLQHERDLSAALRAAERAKAYAHTDAHTGAGNRRHWNAMLAVEAERFRRYANPYAVIVLDLDALPTVSGEHGQTAADELICLTAEMLTSLVRPSDTVARLGEDQFAILAVECDRDGVSALTARLAGAFAALDVDASIGAAVSKPGQGGRATWAAADAAADASKRTLGSLVDLV